MIKTAFLVVPRSTDGAGAAEMARIVDDVKDYVFGCWAEANGFVIGRCYGKGQLMTPRELADWINDPATGGQVVNKLVFPLSYKGGTTREDY